MISRPGRAIVDRSPIVEEDVQRLILDDLLYFFPGPYAMLNSYLDESGTHGPSKVMCVGGFLYQEKGVKSLDQEWKDVLDWAGIDCFHASKWKKRIEQIGEEKENLLYRKLVSLVRKYACGGAVAFGGSESEFKRYRKTMSWGYSQYTTCAYACVGVLLGIAKRLGEEKVDFMFESGHKKLAELNGFLEKLSEAGQPITYGSRPKKCLRLLQTADLWAYETRKRVTDVDDFIHGRAKERTVGECLKVLIGDDPNIMVISLNKESLPALFEQVRSVMGNKRG